MAIDLNAFRPLMVLAFLAVLALLPMTFSPKQLGRLAFLLWLVAGTMLLTRAFIFLPPLETWGQVPNLFLYVGIAVVLGLGKGFSVLAKSAKRNLERLQSYTSPQRAVQLYDRKSWILIAVMMGFGVVLQLLGFDGLIRGLLLLTMGTGLTVGSFSYYKGLKHLPSA
jgi:hypothetical protein